MAKSRLKLLAAVASIAALVAVPLAHAAGYFPYFPVVAGASYCSSVSGTGSGTGGSTFPSTGPTAAFGQGIAGQSGSFTAPCNVTVSAGPASLTGNETLVADTNLASGQQPQTVLMSTRLLGAGATQYATPLTGASLTVAANETTMLLEPAGTIATLTVTLPAATTLIDGQTWRVSSTQTVTALTLTPGTGTTIPNNPTAITISNTGPYGYEFQYKASTAKWYRIQ